MLDLENYGTVDASFPVLSKDVQTVAVPRPTEVEGIHGTALLNRVDGEGCGVTQVLLFALAEVLDLRLEDDGQLRKLLGYGEFMQVVLAFLEFVDRYFRAVRRSLVVDREHDELDLLQRIQRSGTPVDP